MIDLYLGGTKNNPSNVFKWTSGAPLAYSNWYPGEPNNFEGKENCMAMRLDLDGKWNDFDCDQKVKKHWVMCELVFTF